MHAIAQAIPDRLVGSGPAPALPGQRGFMRQNMDLDFVNRSPVGRPFQMSVRNFGTVRVARVIGTPSSFTRARRHLADGRDLISVVVSGGGRFEAEGVAGPNRYAGYGAAVLESRRESALHSLDDSSAWTICMDREPIEPLISGFRQPLQRCIGGDSAPLRLLDGYLHALFAIDGAIDRALCAAQIRDLTLSALGVSHDVKDRLREGGARETRLRVLLDRLNGDAAEPGLDPARLAERLGMSVRYLHRLLEPTGRSFSEHLLAARLDRAAAMLRDPAAAHLRIGEIAARSGFSDISHFNRSYLRAFGDTPNGTRVRAARRREAGRAS